MNGTFADARSRPARLELWRLAVGFIWIAGAFFNLLATLRMDEPYIWIEESPIPIHRWFFGDIVAGNPRFWTVVLVVAELLLGFLTLARRGWAKAGLIGGALFSLFLFTFAIPYTIMMGPYAAFLAWLARKEHRRSILEIGGIR